VAVYWQTVLGRCSTTISVSHSRWIPPLSPVFPSRQTPAFDFPMVSTRWPAPTPTGTIQHPYRLKQILSSKSCTSTRSPKRILEAKNDRSRPARTNADDIILQTKVLDPLRAPGHDLIFFISKLLVVANYRT
jgi:hypothetical protein